MTIRIEVPFYKQQFDYSCGPASLRMIFAYWNIVLSEHDIANLAGTKEHEGTTPTGLVQAIRSVGLKYHRSAQALLKDIQEALQKNHPVLIHYREPEDESSHYAVVVGITGKDIILNDAYHGKDFTMSHTEFKRRWIGYINYPHKNRGWMIEVWSDNK